MPPACIFSFSIASSRSRWAGVMSPRTIFSPRPTGMKLKWAKQPAPRSSAKAIMSATSSTLPWWTHMAMPSRRPGVVATALAPATARCHMPGWPRKASWRAGSTLSSEISTYRRPASASSPARWGVIVVPLVAMVVCMPCCLARRSTGSRCGLMVGSPPEMASIGMYALPIWSTRSSFSSRVSSSSSAAVRLSW